MNQEILNQLSVELLQQLNKELRLLYASVQPLFEDEIIDAIADVRYAIKSKVVKPDVVLLEGEMYKLVSTKQTMIGEYLYKEGYDQYIFLVDGRQHVVRKDNIIEHVSKG